MGWARVQRAPSSDRHLEINQNHFSVGLRSEQWTFRSSDEGIKEITINLSQASSFKAQNTMLLSEKFITIKETNRCLFGMQIFI